MTFSLAVVIRTKFNLIMSKRQYYLRKYIENTRDTVMDYHDKNLDKFSRFLIDELLFYIKDIPFRWIIDEYLRMEIVYHGQRTVHSIVWHYTADRQLINGWITYSFRFPNVCHPDLYQSFNLSSYLFHKSTKPRHHSDDWYVYTGKRLPKYIAEYLSIQTIVQVKDLPITRLFVNKNDERIDIYFSFTSIKTKITITFERGTPDRYSNYH